MSTKEERFVILEDDVSSRFLISEVVENGLLLTDTNRSGIKSEICPQADKNSEGKDIKNDIPLNKVQESSVQHFNCALCQNVCTSCKSICVTCKAPCNKCNLQRCKNSSTDTDDFDKYLESHIKKIKPPVKVKTVGTDTCDLEGHFDYYKSENKVVKIQKHVATDCIDLNLRKIVTKKPVRTSIAVDTSDLHVLTTKSELNDESNCEFYWTNTEDSETLSNQIPWVKSPKTEEKNGNDDSENSLVIDEDASCFPSIKEESLEDFEIPPRILNLEDSTSDDSDIDLATSCRVSKCRKLAREHKITLKQFFRDDETYYECIICCERFFKKNEGVLHLGNHIESNLFKCLSCGEKFATLDLLFSHVKVKHEQIFYGKLKTENKENSGVDFTKPKVSKIYHCTLCPKGEEAAKFDSYKSLNLHQKETHGIDRTKDNSNEKVEKTLRIKREFICLICGKQFKSSKALKDHSPVHTGEKNYQCDICKKSYTTSANLKIHQRTHTGAKNFVCSVCGKAFHKKDSLKVHFRKHSGERPFQCDLCPMKFDRNYILKNHRYTHFSEKKFICPVCGKTFTTHGGLNNHEKGHKKDPFAKKPRKPAVKPTLDTENAVICDVCGKIYSTRSNLRIHKFVHLGVKPFECTICHQTYAKKDSMLTHMRKHTDERPFACETCGMTFYRNHTLKTHLLRHTGERPHKCKMCGKSFTQSSSLAYHVKNHDKKVEKKKVADDPTKNKKKRVNQGNKLNRVKKVQKIMKLSDIDLVDMKPLFGEKKLVEESTNISILKTSIPINLPNKDPTRSTHFVVREKEIVILDKNLDVELPRNFTPGKETDFYTLDKEISYENQCSTGKFNYCIPKSHVFTVQKDMLKVKKEPEMSMEKNGEDVANVIIPKNSYITKEGNLVTLNRDSSLKEVKEFMQVGDERLDLKSQTAMPLTGEILNAAFISDENGDMIPLSSMALQGLSSDSVMVSPLIPVEGDEQKEFLRNSRAAYSLSPSRVTNEKTQTKGSYRVINLKDSRNPQKIKIELESTDLQIQAPVDDEALQGMPGFYNNVQQNAI